jgi:hypothetical protein
MNENASSIASKRRLMAGVVSVATFMVLCAVALPGMETSLVFIPILALSAVAGVVSWAAMRYVARRSKRTS